jgi:membrane associated rhomboid family serine protease
MQITGALIIFVATIATSLLALFGAPQLLDRSLFRPYWLLRRREYDTLIMSGFVHADLVHLLFNMMTFYFFAFDLERRIGTTSFVVLYILGLVFSHLGTWYKHRDHPEYASLGASGAISAVLLAAILYSPYGSMYILPLPVPIPSPLFAVAYLAYSYYASKNPVGRINHDAHLGGALTGLVFVALTAPELYPAFFQALF